MILSGLDIIEQVKAGNIDIHGFDQQKVGPNSYDLTLAPTLLVYDCAILDTRQINRCHSVKIPKEGYVLQPGELYLGQTAEYTITNQHVPMIDGRSSMGRLGLFVHVTAGFGDVGFRGYWTLELAVIKPLRVYAGDRICQISYHTVSERFVPYTGKYQLNGGVMGSRSYMDIERNRDE